MSYDRKTKFSKNHKNPSFPKLVPGVLPFRLEGREPQNRKIEKIQFFIFGGGLSPGRRHLAGGLFNLLSDARRRSMVRFGLD